MVISIRKLLSLLKRTSSVKELAAFFKKQVITYFDCQYVSFYKVSKKNNNTYFQIVDQRFGNCIKKNDLSTELLESSLELVKKNENHIYSDSFIIETKDSEIKFLFFGYLNKSLFVCFWDSRLENKKDLESLIYCIQHECLWLKKLEKKNELIYQDNLTGLYNDRYLSLFFDQEIKRFNRYRKPFSLLFIDIDYFKLINDQYGHLVGSKVLYLFGQALKSLVREVDLIVRYGGDEFVVLLLGTNKEIAKKVSTRICDGIKKKIFFEKDLKIKLTVSIGITSYSKIGTSKQQLIQTADQAMYKSKKNGRNQVCYLELR